MASTDAFWPPRKNTAFRVTFPIFDADGDLVAGATGLDSEVSKDGGAFADCTNEATEIATSSGMYYLDLTSTEMNADTVAVIVKSSGKTTPIVLYPQEDGDQRVNTVQVGGTSQTAGDLAALITTVDDLLDTEIAAIKAKTDNLPADPADASDIAALFDALPTAAENATELLDQAAGVETGLTVRQWLRLAASALFGKASGLATTTAVYRDFGDTKDRITATVDADGNRTAVTRDAT